MNREKQPLPEKASLEALASSQASQREQSVRTTFKLSAGLMDFLMVWKQNGMAIKNLMDIACSLLDPKTDEEHSFLRDSLQRVKGGTVETSSSGIRKTVVLSKRSLHIINNLSQEHRVSRGALVEAALAEFLWRKSRQMEATKEKDRKALPMIREFEEQGSLLEDKLSEFLGKDDPVVVRFGKVMVLLMNLIFAMESEIEEGTPIDPSDL